MREIGALFLIVSVCGQSISGQNLDPCKNSLLPCSRAATGLDPELGADDPPGDAIMREAAGDTDVRHSSVDFEIANVDTSQNRCSVNGVAVMTVRSKSAALTEFTFRLRNQLLITDALINEKISVDVDTLSPTTRHVTLDHTYSLNEEFTLRVVYGGLTFSEDIFGSITAQNQNGNPAEAIVSSRSKPFYSYTWWPCKDGDIQLPGDNSDKASIDMSITAPNNWQVASNGVLQGVDPLSNNRNRYRWSTITPVSTYQVSFAATNYNHWTATYNYPDGPTFPAGSMPVEFYIYPQFDNAANRTAWQKCLAGMTVFRDLFGEYPFIQEKYGICNLNPAATAASWESHTLAGQSGFGESQTIHELSHQWWGNHVTPRTWNDIWLSEGLATYSECLWEERKNGGLDTAAYFAAMNARRPEHNGTGSAVFVYDTLTTANIFSSDFSYKKPAWVLHMLRHIVGDTAFFDILQEYRAAFEGGTATTSDFAGIAAGVSGMNLAPFFNQWIYNKGAPIYSYGWEAVNLEGQDYLLLKIEQTQLPTQGPAPQVLDVYQMPIDLVVTISGAPTTLVVNNNAREQWYSIPTAGPVSALAFDPAPWILRGPASLVTYEPGPPQIVSTTPQPGEIVPDEVSDVEVTFNTAVSAISADFSVVGTTTGVHSFTLTAAPGPTSVNLHFATPLPQDSYTLTIQDSVNANGFLLDGEIADPDSPSSLPSGNGVPGGDSAIHFGIVPCNFQADIDGDCDVDDDDLSIFTQVLLGIDVDGNHHDRSDFDGNDVVNGLDIPLFIAAYLNP